MADGIEKQQKMVIKMRAIKVESLPDYAAGVALSGL